MNCKDNVGNVLKIGDEVLIKVPKSDATYRVGVIKDFKDVRDNGYGNILIEYKVERLYCTQKKWAQDQKIKFKYKATKAWRFSSDVVKYRKDYIVNDC